MGVQVIRGIVLVLLINTVPAIAQADFDHPKLDGSKQYYFRNYIEFTGSREAAGASGFFVERNGVIQYITAKHVLGPSMGIEPAVSPDPAQFENELVSWTVITPPNYEPMAFVYELATSSADLTEDRIALNALMVTDVDPAELGDMPMPTVEAGVLEIARTMPSRGDPLFLIGCPYSQEDCSQNTYQLISRDLDSDGYLNASWSGDRVELSGFSGAPVVNQQGEVVAMVVVVSHAGNPVAQPIVGW